MLIQLILTDGVEVFASADEVESVTFIGEYECKVTLKSGRGFFVQEQGKKVVEKINNKILFFAGKR